MFKLHCDLSDIVLQQQERNLFTLNKKEEYFKKLMKNIFIQKSFVRNDNARYPLKIYIFSNS